MQTVVLLKIYKYKRFKNGMNEDILKPTLKRLITVLGNFALP